MSILGIAFENIDFQLNNNLPKELDRLFTNMINDKQSYMADKSISDLPSIVKYFEDKFKKEYSIELKNIINKYTNINCKLIKDIGTFAIQFTGSDLFDFLLGTLGAEGLIRIDKIDDKTFKKMLSLQDAIDFKNAKIKKLPIKLNCRLYFDLNFALFAKELSLRPNDSYVPEPKEITAIMLHEIGHFFTMIEYASNLMYVGYYGNNLIYNTLKSIRNNDVKNIQKLMDKNKKFFENMLDSLSNRYTVNSIINRFIKNLKHFMDNLLNMKARDTYSATLVAITFIILISFFLVLFFLEYIFTYLLGDDISGSMVEIGASRETGSKKQSYLFELVADEFVSKFGYSRYLNSGLEKIYKYSTFATDKYTAGYLVHNKWFGPLRFLQFILRIGLMFIKLIPYPFYILGMIDDYQYEALHKRMERNLMFMYDNFKKAKDIPKDILDTIIRDTDQMKSELKKISNPSFGVRSIKFIVDWILLGKLQKVLFSGTFGTGGMNEEIRTFLDVTDKLTSNVLYFHSSKLQRIAERL